MEGHKNEKLDRSQILIGDYFWDIFCTPQVKHLGHSGSSPSPCVFHYHLCASGIQTGISNSYLSNNKLEPPTHKCSKLCVRANPKWVGGKIRLMGRLDKCRWWGYSGYDSRKQQRSDIKRGQSSWRRRGKLQSHGRDSTDRSETGGETGERIT